MTKFEGELISLPGIGGIGVKLTEQNVRLPLKVVVDSKTGEVTLKVASNELDKMRD